MLLDEPHQPIYTFVQIYVAAGKVDFIRTSEVIMCKVLSTSLLCRNIGALGINKSY